jgi:hypothetical protein
MPSPIDPVIDRLGAILAAAQAEQSRIGYFAALYRRVTIAVRDGIAEFSDPARMERFDVLFASRYLDALSARQAGGQPTRSWQAAFAATQDPQPIVLQHLLLGINAHINLDLGIAAAQVAPGDQLPGLKPDFLRINALLASLVPAVMAELAAVSPLLGLLEQVVGEHDDDKIANFSLSTSRDWAWHVATLLAPLDPPAQAPVIATLDKLVSGFARHLWHPDPILRAVYKLIRDQESDSPAQVIAVLEREG